MEIYFDSRCAEVIMKNLDLFQDLLENYPVCQELKNSEDRR